MAANQQLTQTDASAPCRKGLSHTCSDRLIDPTLGDAGLCTQQDALYCHPESYLAHAVCHRWGLGWPCYFVRERIVEQMCCVQAPQSSGSKKETASQSRVSSWAPGQSVQSVQFDCSDFYVPPGCFSKQFSPAAVSHALSRGSQPAVPTINSVHRALGGDAVGQMCMTQREGAISCALSIIPGKIISYREEGMGRLKLRTKV